MVYDDFIAASYNFRYGVYGGIERGGKYTVATFPKKGPSSYEVRVASKEEEDKRKKSEKLKDGKEYYVKLFLDPEVTRSKEGLIEGWLSKELYPTEGTIKDVILFGDVKGTLIKKKIIQRGLDCGINQNLKLIPKLVDGYSLLVPQAAA
jgi:hypothetical protein